MDFLHLTEDVEKLRVEKESMAAKYGELEEENLLLAEDVEAEKAKVSALKTANAEERTKLAMMANFSVYCAHVRALNFANVPLSDRAWSELVYPCPHGAPPKPLDWANLREEELPRLPGQTISTALRPHSMSTPSTPRPDATVVPPSVSPKVEP